MPCRDPEHALGGVLVPVLQHSLAGVLSGHEVVAGLVSHQLRQPLLAELELVRDVLQEQQPEHDVLVLSGIHGGTQSVRGLPERIFQTQRAGLRSPCCHSHLLVRRRPASTRGPSQPMR